MHTGFWFGRIAFVFAALVMAAPVTDACGATLSTIHTFCSLRECTDGLQPTEGVTRDPAGNLFGATNSESGDTAYELTGKSNGKWKETVLDVRCARCHRLAPVGGFIEDTAGNLYTVTAGGKYNTGAIVELAVVAGSNKRQTLVLYSFGPNGSGDAYGSSGLTYAGAASGLPYDGVSPLYGASGAGGARGNGTVYALTPSGGTWSEQILYSFCAAGDSGCGDGGRPNAPPMLDASGNLYGTTFLSGPSDGEGVVYELSNSGGTWSETVLHANCQLHDCADGLPIGGLVQDASGNLFGAALYGSHQRAGLIFKLVPDGTSSIYSVIYDFCSVPRNCRDGANPQGPLIVDASGNLFGTTRTGGGHDIDQGHLGGGTVFELSGSTLTTLYAFCAESDCRDGEYPNGMLAMDPSGNLFGTTNLGGRLGEGTAFEVSP